MNTEQIVNYVGKNQLNLFTPPPTQIATEHYTYQTFYPRDAVSETNVGNPIVFHISGITDFLDLKNNLLYAQFQIKDIDGGDIPEAVKVNPIDYIINSFIRQMKIFINNKLVYDSGDTYYYKSYIETLLNNTFEVKKTTLAMGGFYDEQYVYDHFTIDSLNSISNNLRAEMANNSKVFEVMGKIHPDICNQPNYLLPNTDVRIEIFRLPHSQTLKIPTSTIAQDANPPIPVCQLYLKQIYLKIRKVQINKSLAVSIEKSLMKSPAKYPIKRTSIRVFQVDRGTQDLVNKLVYTGQLPVLMIVCFVDNDIFYGDTHKSPFNFKNFGLESVQVDRGGKKYPAEKPLEMNIQGRRIAETYFQFLSTCGFANNYSETNGINMRDYITHRFFLGFDFHSDMENDGVVELMQFGEVRLNLKFSINLPQNIKVITYLSFDNMLKIDAMRNAILDYST